MVNISYRRDGCGWCCSGLQGDKGAVDEVGMGRSKRRVNGLEKVGKDMDGAWLVVMVLDGQWPWMRMAI